MYLDGADIAEQGVRTTIWVPDRVYVLDYGNVVFHGTPQELDARDDIKKHHMGV